MKVGVTELLPLVAVEVEAPLEGDNVMDGVSVTVLVRLCALDRLGLGLTDRLQDGDTLTEAALLGLYELDAVPVKVKLALRLKDTVTLFEPVRVTVQLLDGVTDGFTLTVGLCE